MSPYAGFVDMVVKVCPTLKPAYVTVYDGVVLYNTQKPFLGCNVYRDARVFAQAFCKVVEWFRYVAYYEDKRAMVLKKGF